MLRLKKITHVTAIILSLGVASCTLDNDNTLETQKHIAHQGDFGMWDHSIKTLFKGGRFSDSEIKNKYAKTHSYHPVFMGQSWIEDMGALAAQNSDFREAVLDAASGHKKSYARQLINNPQAITSLPESPAAFRNVLNYIAKNDAVYQDNKTRLEAYARRQNIPNIQTRPKTISYFSMYDYSTTSATNPSVMERILNVAAFKVLGLDQDSNYKQDISRLSQNRAMTGCFETAKRNSQQCQAAAHDNYDLSYCMASHNVSEVSNCFSWMLP